MAAQFIKAGDRVYPFRAKVIFKTLPNQFVSNIILGYLGADSAAEGAIVYKEWVRKKD